MLTLLSSYGRIIGQDKGYIRKGDMEINIPEPKKQKDRVPRRSRTITFVDNMLEDPEQALDYAKLVNQEENQQRKKNSTDDDKTESERDSDNGDDNDKSNNEDESVDSENDDFDKDSNDDDDWAANFVIHPHEKELEQPQKEPQLHIPSFTTTSAEDISSCLNDPPEIQMTELLNEPLYTESTTMTIAPLLKTIQETQEDPAENVIETPPTKTKKKRAKTLLKWQFKRRTIRRRLVKDLEKPIQEEEKEHEVQSDVLGKHNPIWFQKAEKELPEQTKWLSSHVWQMYEEIPQQRQDLERILGRLERSIHWDPQVVSEPVENSEFGRNDESKKMQKYLLKQQFESFYVSNSEGLHKGYDTFQSLLSQLETHGAGVSTKDANQKFLRSLPSSWSQVSLIMRTKPGVNTLNFNDLYYNLRVFESDVRGSTGSSSSSQNVAFVSSENTSSTNEVNTAYGGSTSFGNNTQKDGSSSYTDDLIYSFFANQSSSPQLDHEDLEQVDEFDLEEMDLKWQVAMISTRMKKFYKKTGRKLHFDAKEPVGFDKSKVECFNCQYMTLC
nr:ribonuclease H-like domain-containing protein [Tanacetum cinerariifolium]